MARVELARIPSGRVVESTEVVVDYDDDHGLVDLLKRMAKRHYLDPTEAELRVQDGRRVWRTIRI